MCPVDTSAPAAFQQKLQITLNTHGEEIQEVVVARIRNNGLDLPIDPDSLSSLGIGAIETLNLLSESIEEGFEWSSTLPPAIGAYIRYLARAEVSLETVLRLGWLVGGALLEVIVSKFDRGDAKAGLHFISAWGAENLDRLFKAFRDEHLSEQARLAALPTGDLRRKVGRQLAGGSKDAGALGYRMDACHTGLILVGDRADLICRRMAATLGSDLLLVPDAENTFWAWVGAQRRIGASDIVAALPAGARSLAIAVGEPSEGIQGWRLTHGEALSALPVARLEGPGLVRYSDVALLASALCDAQTAKSLTARYLEPIDSHRDAGVLRKTLLTYFDLNCNAVSTASALGVNRHTVQRRLKRVEGAVGEPPAARQAEFGLALQLEELTERTRATISS